MRKLLLITAALAALTTQASAITTSGRTCVRHNEIYNWAAIDDKHIVVEDNRHKKVLLKLIGTCQNLRFHETIAFRNPAGFGLDCISTGDDVLVRSFASGVGRCSVVDVQPYSGSMNWHDHSQADDHNNGDHNSSDHDNGNHSNSY